MTTRSVQPKVAVKAGSISLSQARAAARAAKTGHYLRVVSGDAKPVDSLWERYLGHFGGARKGASRPKAKSAKKRRVTMVKSSAKKAAAKRTSAKKR